MRPIRAALALAILGATMIAPPAWTLAPQDSQASHMNFSHVTTRAQAEALVKSGELVRIRLFPKRFGGRGDKENIGYVPPGALMMIDFANDRVSGLLELKAIDRLAVEPKYRGKSIVPVRIVYICSGEGEGTIEMKMNIW